MAISEREHHIKVLEQFLHDYQEWGEDLELEKTIKYAISSLKTDEAYQIMYEGGVLFTVDEVLTMLENIKSQIDDYMNRKWETLTDADKAGCPTLDDWKYHMAEATEDFIDEKINELKED